MTQEEFLDLLRKYRSRTCTAQEKKLVEDWFEALSTDKEPFSNSADELQMRDRLWKDVDQHIEREVGTVRRDQGKSVFLRWSFASIAATFLTLLIAFWYVGRTPFVLPAFDQLSSPAGIREKTITNDGDHASEFFLPDGSRIRLLSQSKITFAADFQAKKREVSLDGEAYFDVAPDVSRPFLVYTNALTTEVLGTSFSVRAYRGQKEIVVTVQTGKVSVYKNSTAESPAARNEQVILTPNQQVVYSTEAQLTLRKLVREPQVILPQPTLKNTYSNAPVIEILSALEENYGIDIRYDENVLSDCTLTSDMSEEGFYEQINIICNALGAQYVVDESAVIIAATGCKPFNNQP